LIIAYLVDQLSASDIPHLLLVLSVSDQHIFAASELGLHAEAELVGVVFALALLFVVVELQFVVEPLVVAARNIVIVDPSQLPFDVWLYLRLLLLMPIYLS
jgi:hypothetical protein